MTQIDWTRLVSEIRPFLEVLSFAASTLLGILGVLVLLQIRLARQSLRTAQLDIQTRIEREAIILAAEQCARFASEIIPPMSAQIVQSAQAGIKLEPFEPQNSKFDATTIDLRIAKEWFTQTPGPARDEFIKTLNLMESFAMYFVGGAANEEMAFPSVGTVFCSYVNYLVPLLVLLRTDQSVKTRTAAGPYQNLITLYTKWSSRLEDRQLDENVQKLLSRKAEIDPTPLPIHGSNEHSR